jgi:hypothetical protein
MIIRAGPPDPNKGEPFRIWSNADRSGGDIISDSVQIALSGEDAGLIPAVIEKEKDSRMENR